MWFGVTASWSRASSLAAMGVCSFITKARIQSFQNYLEGPLRVYIERVLAKIQSMLLANVLINNLRKTTYLPYQQCLHLIQGLMGREREEGSDCVSFLTYFPKVYALVLGLMIKSILPSSFNYSVCTSIATPAALSLRNNPT
jgi:hypothetical protein